MAPCGKKIDLARLITFTVLHHEQGYVGYNAPSGDASAAFLATGKTVIIECAHPSEPGSPLRFTVEQAVLDLHRDSPVPVYVAVPQRSISGQSLGVGLYSARALTTQVVTGAVRAVPWHRFWRAQSSLAPSAAPPTHIASTRELTAEDLANPDLATRLSADELHCDTEEPIPARHLIDVEGSEDKFLPWVWQIPHPDRRLFHYAWTDGGHRPVETEAWRERLRDHLRSVEEARARPSGPALVITRPWRTLRRLSRTQLAAVLLRAAKESEPRWAGAATDADDDA